MSATCARQGFNRHSGNSGEIAMADEQLEAGQDQAPEKVDPGLSQDHVNSLVGRAKSEGYEKAKRQFEAENQQKLEAANAKANTDKASGNGTANGDFDSVYQQVQERLNADKKAQDEAELGHYLAQTYQGHLASGAEKYSDFQEKIEGINFSNFPGLLTNLAGIDNADDVLYELGNNLGKANTIENLSERSHDIASRELKKISESIKANKQALAQESQSSTNSPLDRMQSSSKAAGSNGKADYRSLDYLKG